MVSVIAAQQSPLAQEFAKKGSPVSYRGQIWCQILNVNIDDVVSMGNHSLSDRPPLLPPPTCH